MNIAQKELKYMVSCTMRDVVYNLVERNSMDIKEALRTLYNSDTLKTLQDPASGLYYQSPLYTYACLDNEIRMGKI